MKIIGLLFVFFLSGCASLPAQNSYSDTMDIIEAAATAAPAGVEGVYRFNVKATGHQRGYVYLNTELDYRDQRCITIAITPSVAKAFAKRFGSSPEAYFVNKSIQVTGEAKRKRIDFYSKGRLTDLYYYQTHIRVSDPGQIKLLNET